MASNNNNSSSSKNMTAREKAGLGAGIAAAAAAAALGTYLLYGSKNAPKNRAKVKGWMLKAKGEVLSELENMEHVTEGAYRDVVNNVLASYRGVRNIRPAELVELASDLRRHWKNIAASFDKSKGKGGSRPKAKRASRSKSKSKPKSK